MESLTSKYRECHALYNNTTWSETGTNNIFQFLIYLCIIVINTIDMNINMKMIANFISYIAMFMGLIAISRYVIDGSLENWVWYRSLFLVVAVASFYIWRNNKRGAYDDQDNT